MEKIIEEAKNMETVNFSIYMEIGNIRKINEKIPGVYFIEDEKFNLVFNEIEWEYKYSDSGILTKNYKISFERGRDEKINGEYRLMIYRTITNNINIRLITKVFFQTRLADHCIIIPSDDPLYITSGTLTKGVR